MYVASELVYLAEVLARVLVQLPDLPSPPSALFPSLRLGEYLGKIAYESKYAATVHLLQETPHPVKDFLPICSENPCRNVIRKAFEPKVDGVLRACEGLP